MVQTSMTEQQQCAYLAYKASEYGKHHHPGGLGERQNWSKLLEEILAEIKHNGTTEQQKFAQTWYRYIYWWVHFALASLTPFYREVVELRAYNTLLCLLHWDQYGKMIPHGHVSCKRGGQSDNGITNTPVNVTANVDSPLYHAERLIAMMVSFLTTQSLA